MNKNVSIIIGRIFAILLLASITGFCLFPGTISGICFVLFIPLTIGTAWFYPKFGVCVGIIVMAFITIAAASGTINYFKNKE